jgi:hypothetical protein
MMPQPQVILSLTKVIHQQGWRRYLDREVTGQLGLGFRRVVIRLTGRWANSRGGIFAADDYPLSEWRRMAGDLRAWRSRYQSDLDEVALYIGRPYHHTGHDRLDRMGPVLTSQVLIERMMQVHGVVDRIEFDSLWGPEPTDPTGPSKMANRPHIWHLINLIDSFGVTVAGEIRHAASASEAERRFPVIRGKVSTWDNEDPEKFGRNVNRYAKNLDHLGEVAIAPIHNLRSNASQCRDETRELMAAGYTARIFNGKFNRDLEFWTQ